MVEGEDDARRRPTALGDSPEVALALVRNFVV
jgi:hypothetical protein